MEIKECEFGRGVFATKTYQAGDLIEKSPVIVLNRQDTEIINSTVLYDYYFSWGTDGSQAALALGNGSLFNHSYAPNARYIKKIDTNEVEFVALAYIGIGEQIFVNYNGNPGSKKQLWFKAR